MFDLLSTVRIVTLGGKPTGKIIGRAFAKPMLYDVEIAREAGRSLYWSNVPEHHLELVAEPTEADKKGIIT